MKQAAYFASSACGAQLRVTCITRRTRKNGKGRGTNAAALAVML